MSQCAANIPSFNWGLTVWGKFVELLLRLGSYFACFHVHQATWSVVTFFLFVPCPSAAAAAVQCQEEKQMSFEMLGAKRVRWNGLRCCGRYWCAVVGTGVLCCGFQTDLSRKHILCCYLHGPMMHHLYMHINCKSTQCCEETTESTLFCCKFYVNPDHPAGVSNAGCWIISMKRICKASKTKQICTNTLITWLTEPSCNGYKTRKGIQ